MVLEIGDRLRALRRKKKLSQTQVAARLNLSKASVSGYENNTKTPSLDVLIQLSIFYGVTTDYLLGLEERRMLCINGLSDRQEALVKALLEEFGASR